MKLRPVLLVAVALAVLAPGARSAPRPWTIADILALKVVSDPQVSPDGRWIACVVQELNADSSDYQTDVWLAPVSGGEARRLTGSPVADENPRWSPDGKLVAFLSERPRPGVKPDDSADEGKRQIWLIRPDGGEAWLLSGAKGGVSAFEWTRDGATIAYLSKEPKSDERKKKEKDKDDAWTPRSMYAWNRLWVMDVASGKAKQLTSGDLHVSGFSLSPDGRRIAFAGQPTPLIPDRFKSDIYVIAASGGTPVPLVTLRGSDANPAWSPDGRWVAFQSQDGRGDDWYTNDFLCVVPAAGGPVKNLTASFDESVGGLAGGRFVWTPDAGSILFQAQQRTAQHLFRAFVDGAPVQPLTSGPELNAAASLDARGATLAFLREDSEHPRDVWRMDFPGGTPARVTDANPVAREKLAFKKQPVTWKGADGWDIEGLLITPPDWKPGRRVPLVLNVHGGPAGTHSSTCTVNSRIYPWPLFAQQGWAILLPNPRGSGGYGEAFRAANVRDWGGKDYEDTMKGVDAMIERGIADKDRLAVCGWSYGGFMTSTIVTKTDRFKAAVVGAGVTDEISMTFTSDIPEFTRSYFKAWPWEDPAFYVEHSALLHVDRVKTPTSLVHGQSDDRVPTSQGWEFYGALQRVGVPTDLLLLPRQPHGPREPRLQRATQQWHLDWLTRWTLGAERVPAPLPGRKARPASGTGAGH
ncbi:MAG: S9 family peptidase [Candidatus Eisenbacteria bacterium]|nr:S9 family peptidase [Candidatus Eisenbacteria bacterium]